MSILYRCRPLNLTGLINVMREKEREEEEEEEEEEGERERERERERESWTDKQLVVGCIRV